MNAHGPSRRLRFIAAGVATAALAVTATMAVSYARPLGKAGYGGHVIMGGYGGYGTAGTGAR